MAYERIEDYGLIGNMRTAALVSKRGSIDWLCFPRFDSPSVFGALLDDEKGGSFGIGPVDGEVTYKQLYFPDTNVLITRFLSPHGVGEIEDFMPAGEGTPPQWRDQLIRRVKVVRGSIEFDVHCDPSFDYGCVQAQVTIDANGAVFEGPGGPLALASQIALRRTPRGAGARFTLREGEKATFALGVKASCDCGTPPNDEQSEELFASTIEFWRHWLAKCTYRGRWREVVNRSALVLKLLTYEPTGALIAAPTCSLPEEVGGVRNWDYRFTWIRDAAFTVYALLRIGFTQEATQFMSWIQARAKEAGREPLQVAYGIDGRRDLTEVELPHLFGYKGSRPVRIGNGAHKQLQLDIYGELMDSVYLYNKYATPISYDFWSYLRYLVNWVCDNWRKADEGMWENRGGRQHFVHSKVMCWVAVDRGLRLAEKRSFPADRGRWLAERDAIYEDVMKRSWSDKRQSFVQHYDSEAIDSANLLMPLVFFMSPTDPQMLKTLDAIATSSSNGGLLSDGLVYRYDTERATDGLVGREGTFNICTFWLVEALTRAGRADPLRLERARLLFERMLGYANHVGLYSEQTGKTGEALGNYPQAFTHLSLISAAFNLDRALNARR